MADNSKQISYWNSESGKRWLYHQQALDDCFDNINGRLLEIAGIVRGMHIIDVGAGTGAITLELARATGDEGRVLAADVSEPLLDCARDRARDAAIANIDFVLDDAQTHDFRSGAFDLVVSRFGVMFFADPPAAFANLCGALRPGGRVCLAAWAGADQNEWFEIPKSAAVSVLGKPRPTDPKAPGPLAFADPAYIEEILNQAGLQSVRAWQEGVMLEVAGGLENAADLATNLGPAARILKEKNGSEKDFAEISSRVAAELQRFHDGGRVRVPATVNFATCERGA